MSTASRYTSVRTPVNPESRCESAYFCTFVATPDSGSCLFITATQAARDPELETLGTGFSFRASESTASAGIAKVGRNTILVSKHSPYFIKYPHALGKLICSRIWLL